MSAWFTSREVAERLGVNRGRLKYLVQKDGGVRLVGRDLIFFEEDVERLRQLDKQTGKVPQRGRRRK